MTIKTLIKILQEYNQNAEVRIVANRKEGDTIPITLITRFEDVSDSRFGFARVTKKEISEEKQKKKSKKVVIA